MQISDDTLAVVNYLDQYCDGNLRKKNDFASILEICATYNGVETLSRLIFAGKSLWNISSKLRKANPAAEGIELLQKETERCCNEMYVYLKEISDNADEEIQNRFNDVYLQLTRGAIKNLIDLGHDLAKFKDLQADLRKNSQTQSS